MIRCKVLTVVLSVMMVGCPGSGMELGPLSIKTGITGVITHEAIAAINFLMNILGAILIKQIDLAIN